MHSKLRHDNHKRASGKGTPGPFGDVPGRAVTLGAIAFTGAALALAGCGGSSQTGVAHLSTGASSTTAQAAGAGSPAEGASPEQRMVAFARCMRTNGVPGFPEPVEGHILLHPGSGLTPGSSQFEAATRTCRRLMPGAGPKGGDETPAERQRRAAGLLSFAQCMRAHGVPSFPDPTSTGELSLSEVKAARVDVHAPSVQAAANTCLPAAGGVLTAADVKRAESGGD